MHRSSEELIVSIVGVVIQLIENLSFCADSITNYTMRNAFVTTITAAALVSLATATATPFRPPGWLSSASSRLDIRGGSTSSKKKSKKEDPPVEEEPVTVDAELLYLPGLLDTVISRTRKVRDVFVCSRRLFAV